MCRKLCVHYFCFPYTTYKLLKIVGKLTSFSLSFAIFSMDLNHTNNLQCAMKLSNCMYESVGLNITNDVFICSATWVLTSSCCLYLDRLYPALHPVTGYVK